MDTYIAEAKERPLIVKHPEVFAKSKDERVMVSMHKANIKANNLKEHGTTKWKPQNKLTFSF